MCLQFTAQINGLVDTDWNKCRHLWIKCLRNISLPEKLWNVKFSSEFETRTNVEILKFLWDGNFLFQCILVLIYPGGFREMKYFSIHKVLGRKPPPGTKMDYYNPLCLEMFWSKQFSYSFLLLYSSSTLSRVMKHRLSTLKSLEFEIVKVWSEAWTADCYHSKCQKQLHPVPWQPNPKPIKIK